jgi:hypothetical protein
MGLNNVGVFCAGDLWEIYVWPAGSRWRVLLFADRRSCGVRATSQLFRCAEHIWTPISDNKSPHLSRAGAGNNFIPKPFFPDGRCANAAAFARVREGMLPTKSKLTRFTLSDSSLLDFAMAY